MPECFLSNFLNFEAKINVHLRSGSPTVSRGYVHSCGVCRFISCPCSAFPFGSLFRGAMYAWTANRLLLLHKPVAFQRNFGSWPQGCESFKQTLLDLFNLKLLCKMQSLVTGWWVMNANDFDCQNCNPWFCAPDNSNSDNALSEESCNYHGVFIRLDFHRNDSEVWRKLLVGLCRFLFHPESIHFPR